MRLKAQPCKCKKDDYKLCFKGFHSLFLSSLECKNCHRKYSIKGIFPYMSLQYVDVMFKIILFLTFIYYCILKWLPGVIYMVVLFFMMNYVVYPFLFKLGFMLIDKEIKENNVKKN